MCCRLLIVTQTLHSERWRNSFQATSKLNQELGECVLEDKERAYLFYPILNRILNQGVDVEGLGPVGNADQLTSVQVLSRFNFGENDYSEGESLSRPFLFWKILVSIDFYFKLCYNIYRKLRERIKIERTYRLCQNTSTTKTQSSRV